MDEISIQAEKNTKGILLTIMFSILAVIVLFPVLYTLTNSFMSPQEVAEAYSGIFGSTDAVGLRLLPNTFSLQAYYKVFLATPNYLVKFWISLLLCTFIVLGQLFVSCTGGFAFAKFRFPGKTMWFLCIVLFMLLPIQVTLLPNYILLSKMKLLGTYGALIWPAVFLPFGTFLMTQVFKGIPSEIMEAAKIDSAGTLRILFYIMIPTGKAGFASLIVLSFIDNWNMVEQPIVFLGDTAKYPLSVFLASVSSLNFSLQFVCGILSLFPVTLLFLFFKEELACGIDLSALK